MLLHIFEPELQVV